MVDLRWDGDDFRNEQDSSGTTADLVSNSGELQQGYKHGSLTEGLVAYYPMEKGEGEVLHDGALNNLGQINGSSWISDNQRGTAISFDDSENDHILTGTKVPGDTDITKTAWIKIESFSDNYNPIVCQRDSYSSNDISFYEHNKDLQILVGSSGDTVNIRSSEAFTTDTWYHVAVTRKGNEYQLFVDKNKVANGTGTGSYNPTDQLKIGTFEINGSYFDGQIKDVRLYDRALSQPEIEALYNLTKPSGTQVTEEDVPGQNQGGVSRYKFNGDVNDNWGSNDGTNNGATFNSGVYGQAAEFNGSSDYVSIPSPTHFSSYTISLWAYPKSSNNGEQDVISLYDNNEVSIVLDHPDASEKWRIQQNYNTTWYHVNSDDKVSENTWYHISGRWNGNRMELYVNGVLQGSVSISGMDQQDLYSDIGTRSDQVSEFAFNGKIDDVRIYKTALTPQQVEKLYHKGAYRIPRESTLH
jgi:hypothetical protein